MVAVITRPATARAKPSVRPEPSVRPPLVLIPGGRATPPARAIPARLIPDRVAAHLPSSRPALLAPAGSRMKARPSSRVVRRRRLLVGLVLVLAVVAGLWILLRAIGGVAGGGPFTSSGLPVDGPAPAAAHPTAGQQWVVRPGDTLWGIVQSAGVGGDPRPVVDELAANLHGHPLQIGQTILVP